MFEDDTNKPPTSKEEADDARPRPPPEKYDPDKRSRWPITGTVAWIIWREIDAVRNELDDYRNDCADKLSGWNELRLRACLKKISPQVAIKELWFEAEEGRIKASAIEYKNVKALLGDPIEIPAHYWPYLKPVDDPLTGKAMLTDDQGRVYREVKFRQLDVKELWPKSVENARIVPARKGRKPMYDWEDAMNFARLEFEKRGDYSDPQNAVDGWRSQADWARSVSCYMKKHNGGKEPPDSSVKSHLKDLLDSIRK